MMGKGRIESCILSERPLQNKLQQPSNIFASQSLTSPQSPDPMVSLEPPQLTFVQMPISNDWHASNMAFHPNLPQPANMLLHPVTSWTRGWTSMKPRRNLKHLFDSRYSRRRYTAYADSSVCVNDSQVTCLT